MADVGAWSALAAGVRTSPLGPAVIPAPLRAVEAQRAIGEVIGALTPAFRDAPVDLILDLGDAEGDILSERPVEDISAERIEQVLSTFTGEVEQLPPMYSALKHQGKRLYELARQGIEVEREPRRITIHALEMLDWEAPTGGYLITACLATGRWAGLGALRYLAKG